MIGCDTVHCPFNILQHAVHNSVYGCQSKQMQAHGKHYGKQPQGGSMRHVPAAHCTGVGGTDCRHPCRLSPAGMEAEQQSDVVLVGSQVLQNIDQAVAALVVLQRSVQRSSFQPVCTLL